MTWVALRQHRNELLIVLALLVALAAYLVPIGLDKHDLFTDSGLKACVDAGENCPDLRFQLLEDYNSFNNIVGWFNFAPGIVGILLAVPLVSEFEQRTYRLAWTQSVTRERWLAAKLGVAIAGVAAFAIVLTLLFTWSYAPADQTEVLGGKELGQSFDFEGLMPFAYTFFAFTLALAAGAWSGKAPAAMVVGLVGFVVLRLLVMELLRGGISSSIEIEVGPDTPFADMTRDMGEFWSTQVQEASIFLSLAAGLLLTAVWRMRRQMS